MMAGWDGRLSDAEIWSIVNYLRALARTPKWRSRPRPPRPPRTRARRAKRWNSPSTSGCRSPADPRGDNTRAQLARVNFMREEPGGRRFFVNDLNGPLYILDKQTQAVHDVSGLQRPRGPPGPVPAVHVPAQLRDGPDQRRLRSGLRAQRRLLHDSHGGPDHDGARRTEAGRRGRPRPLRLPDDAAARDADAAGRALQSRSRDRRVDRSRHHEHDLRGHRARTAAAAAVLADPSARRDDVQSRPRGAATRTGA